MKILAIDPGPVESAFVVWTGAHIQAKGKVPNAKMLQIIKEESRDCQHMVCEMIASYGMAVGKEVFETCVWIGRFIQHSGGDMERLFRKDIKIHICGSVKAKDSNIRQALIDRFGGPGTVKNPGVTHGVSKDIWAALAVAVTYNDQLDKQI
jgi:hypothetical protein